MKAFTAQIDKESLTRELQCRIGSLRKFVSRKIPHRFRSTISADDLLQEVWVAAYRTVSSFTPDGPNALDRWLTAIASSKLIDAMRAARAIKRGGDRDTLRNRRDRLTSLGELFARLQSPLKTPSSEFRAAEAAHAVSLSLNCLSDDRRRAVELQYVEGLPRKEIAARMHKPRRL